MSEVASRAQLIDASELGARSQRVAATMPRAEIEEVLRIDDTPELILEVDRRSNGDVDGHMFRVAWTEDQLQALLRDTSGEEITLLFDPDELQQALVNEDVEAHGVREKTAAVLTVAAMAAGAAAAAHPASAQTMASGGGGAGAATTIEMVSDAASSGPAAAAPELISDSASSGPAGVQAAEASGPELISDAASGPAGVQAAEASGPELISDAASGPAPVQAAEASGPELISDAASGPAPVQAAASGVELVSDAALTGTLSPAQSADLAAAPVSTAEAGDSGLSTSEIAGTAAAGGMVLLITAAGFALRGKRRDTQPA
jgi:hypothetical protein